MKVTCMALGSSTLDIIFKKFAWKIVSSTRKGWEPSLYTCTYIIIYICDKFRSLISSFTGISSYCCFTNFIPSGKTWCDDIYVKMTCAGETPHVVKLEFLIHIYIPWNSSGDENQLWKIETSSYTYQLSTTNSICEIHTFCILSRYL